jgi:hypothetical protein
MARYVYGHKKEPTIVPKAVASKDLWIWHVFFGMLGLHNDINVLQRSPIFARLAQGEGPQVNYTINGNEYTMDYYLADGIYPSWATFVKTIPEPRGNKNKYFAKAREACRKDVERAFGFLQSRLPIVPGAARIWDEDTLGNTCIIMHNMIVEDEQDDEVDFNYDDVGEKVQISHSDVPELGSSVTRKQGEHKSSNRGKGQSA